MEVFQAVGRFGKLPSTSSDDASPTGRYTYQLESVRFWIFLHVLEDVTILDPRDYHREADPSLKSDIEGPEDGNYVRVGKTFPPLCFTIKHLRGVSNRSQLTSEK